MAEDLEPINVKHLESSKQTNIRSVQFSFIYIRTDHNQNRLAVMSTEQTRGNVAACEINAACSVSSQHELRKPADRNKSADERREHAR